MASKKSNWRKKVKETKTMNLKFYWIWTTTRSQQLLWRYKIVCCETEFIQDTLGVRKTHRPLKFTFCVWCKPSCLAFIIAKAHRLKRCFSKSEASTIQLWISFIFYTKKHIANHTFSSIVRSLSRSPLNCFEQTINLDVERKKTLFHVHREPFSSPSPPHWNNRYKFKTACSFDCIKRESWHLNGVCTQKPYLSSQQLLEIYSSQERDRLKGTDLEMNFMNNFLRVVHVRCATKNFHLVGLHCTMYYTRKESFK